MAYVTGMSVRVSMTAANPTQKDDKQEQCRCSEYTSYSFTAGSTQARYFKADLKV